MAEASFLLVDIMLYQPSEDRLADVVISSCLRLQEESIMPARLVCENLDLSGVLDDFCQKTGIVLFLR